MLKLVPLSDKALQWCIVSIRTGDLYEPLPTTPCQRNFGKEVQAVEAGEGQTDSQAGGNRLVSARYCTVDLDVADWSSRDSYEDRLLS